MSEERETNLRLRGRLTADPSLRNTAANKLIAEFSVCYQPNKKYPAVFIDCVTMRDEVSQYIAANYKKGSEIKIVNATPTSRKGKDGKQYIKWVVWDVVVSEGENLATEPDNFDDEPPY